jgi:ceramide glucosyltransferase
MMQRTWADRLAVGMALLFAVDRLLKLAAVAHFFRRPPPAPPPEWPTVALLQPVSRSAHDLRATLATRAALRYPALVKHILICDAADDDSQAICQSFMAAHPDWAATLLLVASDDGLIASKIDKIMAALPHATADILCCVDDDIALRPDALRVLVSHLLQPGAGAVFGLACYTNWRTLPSSLLSGFVNANALLSYIPLSYLTAPFTITGHCFALRRDVFDTIGGFSGMAQRIDDDHELARRVRSHGLRCVQTPLIYDVDNYLESMASYRAQFKRWFVIPRETMVPWLTPREQAVSLLGSLGNLLLPLSGLLALGTRRRAAVGAFGASMALFAAVYAWCERAYSGRYTPLRRWPLLLVVALVTPLQVLSALLSDGKIEWRGQRLRVHRGGRFEVLP